MEPHDVADMRWKTQRMGDMTREELLEVVRWLLTERARYTSPERREEYIAGRTALMKKGLR